MYAIIQSADQDEHFCDDTFDSETQTSVTSAASDVTPLEVH